MGLKHIPSTLRIHLLSGEVKIEGHCVVHAGELPSGDFVMMEFRGEAGLGIPSPIRVALYMKLIPQIIESLERLVASRPQIDRN